MNAKTNKKHAMVHSALLAALSLVGTQAFAEPPKMPELPNGWEACGGVARAGMNDCAIKTSLHSCVGMAKTDNEPDSYVFLPKGLCAKLAKGKVLPITKQDVEEMKAKMKKM
ncbi:BufA1 family periplasmic bufferin-type metallophore [Nitrospira sp. Kam-Ns4a]